MADTADGYAPTFAMARLLSRESLTVSGKALARGAFLILGGDEVYPVASREAYEERLKAPFDAASADANPEPPPHNFLRFRIGRDGSLTIYALGLDRLGGKPRLVDELVLKEN